MPSPIFPQDIKETIPSPTGNFCQKFVNILKLPSLIYQWFAWAVAADGKPSVAFATEVCALNCTGDIVQPTNVPVLTATDGLYTNKVVVQWTKPTGATSYEVFRNDGGVNSATDAATVSIGVTAGNIWEDTNVVADKIYYYWVKATIGGVQGSFSNGDAGSVGDSQPTLAPVQNLKVGQGYYGSNLSQGLISLEFDAVSDADSYEIYRSTTGAFAGEEVLINPEDVPGTTWRRWQTPSPGPSRSTRSSSYQDHSGFSRIYIDNFWVKKNGRLLFTDDALPALPSPLGTGYTWLTSPVEGTTYSYRVVPKKRGSTLTGVLADATTKTGYSGARPGYTTAGSGVVVSETTWVANAYTIVTAGKTKMRVVLRAQGGNGSGGDTGKGGAGGGAGGLVTGEFALAGEVWTMELSAPASIPAVTAHEVSGAEGYSVILKKDGVEVLKASGGKGGVYNVTGACTGGVGGSGNLHGITPNANNEILDGENGYADTDLVGGYGGANFGYSNARGQTSGLSGSGSGGNGQEVATNPLLKRSPRAALPPQFITTAA